MEKRMLHLLRLEMDWPQSTESGLALHFFWLALRNYFGAENLPPFDIVQVMHEAGEKTDYPLAGHGSRGADTYIWPPTENGIFIAVAHDSHTDLLFLDLAINTLELYFCHPAKARIDISSTTDDSQARESLFRPYLQHLSDADLPPNTLSIEITYVDERGIATAALPGFLANLGLL